MISAATILDNGAADTHSGGQVSAGARQQLSACVNLSKHETTYLLWFWILQHGEASKVSAYFFLTPVFGLLAGALLLSEPLRTGS